MVDDSGISTQSRDQRLDTLAESWRAATQDLAFIPLTRSEIRRRFVDLAADVLDAVEPTTAPETAIARSRAIGRALIAEPALLLLDEPSAALSPKLVDQVFEKVTEINLMGTAIMMVEQNAKKALAISDRGYVLEMGRNRYEGPGRTLLLDADVRGLYLGG